MVQQRLHQPIEDTAQETAVEIKVAKFQKVLSQAMELYGLWRRPYHRNRVAGVEIPVTILLPKFPDPKNHPTPNQKLAATLGHRKRLIDPYRWHRASLPKGLKHQ